MQDTSIQTCFRRLATENGNINLCQANEEPTNTITITCGEHTLRCLFDSGADCSLVRESIASSLPSERRNNIKTLRGIRPVPVLSLSQIIITCNINGITIEIELYVVLDHEISTNILIDRNLLQIPGIKAELTSAGTIVSRTRGERVVLCLHKLNFNYINTDLTSKEKITTLVALLNKYRHTFVHGTSTTRIKTGELTIRLKNPEKIVNRRPYRLAPIEREKVQKILEELLQNNIIRENNSHTLVPLF